MKAIFDNIITAVIIFAMAIYAVAHTWFSWLAYHQRFPNAEFWTFLFQQ